MMMKMVMTMQLMIMMATMMMMMMMMAMMIIAGTFSKGPKMLTNTLSYSMVMTNDGDHGKDDYDDHVNVNYHDEWHSFKGSSNVHWYIELQHDTRRPRAFLQSRPQVLISTKLM